MSFFKEIFKCCQPVSQTSKTDIVVESNGNEQAESSNATGSFGPIIQTSPKENKRSLIMNSNGNDKTIKNTPLIFSSFDGSAVIAPGIQNRESIYGQPDYVPVNDVEMASLQPTRNNKLEIRDVAGNILKNQKVEISLKGLKRHNRLSIISTGESPIDIIKSINYFWINNTKSSQLLINSNQQKDFTLNLSCDQYPSLGTEYLFMICYIKEKKYYKIKFNDTHPFDLLSQNIFIKVLNSVPIIVPKNALLTIGNFHMEVNVLSKCIIEVSFNQKRYVFHSINQNYFTIGKGKDCNIQLPTTEEVSEVHTSFYFEDKKNWMIKDGDDKEPSTSGTWIFSMNPIIINNEMHIKFWNKEIEILCK